MGIFNDNIDIHEYEWLNNVMSIVLIILFCIACFMYCTRKHEWKTIYEDETTKIERCEECGMEKYHNLIEEQL